MKKYLLAAAIGASLSLAPPIARAAPISATLTEFTGDDAQVTVTITEVTGGVQFNLQLNQPTSGDITGFWANLASEPPTVTVEPNSNVAEFSYDPNNVNNLGNGVNLNGGGSPAPLDFGVRFNKPGDGSLTSVSFVLSGASLSDFEGQTFAARLQALGGGAEGSSKLVGSPGGGGPPPPEPSPVPDASSTAMLLGMSLCGIEWLRRKLVK